MSLSDIQWKRLLSQVRDGRCVPFIGSGVATPTLPTGGELAEELSKAYNLPLDASNDLSAVAEHIAIAANSTREPKDHFAERARKAVAPPHYTNLAELPIKLFVTTNYDDLLEQALRKAGKHPQLEIPAWNGYILHQHRNEVSAMSRDEGYDPSVDYPLILHLHGHYKYPATMVMTDSDYAEFLSAWRAHKNWLVPDGLHYLFGLHRVPWTPSLGVLTESEVRHGDATDVQSGVQGGSRPTGG